LLLYFKSRFKLSPDQGVFAQAKREDIKNDKFRNRREGFK